LPLATPEAAITPLLATAPEAPVGADPVADDCPEAPCPCPGGLLAEQADSPAIAKQARTLLIKPPFGSPDAAAIW
jgi:hypothetical protein